MQESHIHALINVLRYCYLDDALQGENSLVSCAALHRLFDTKELDYLTHVVLRMYENTLVCMSNGGDRKSSFLFSIKTYCYCYFSRIHLTYIECFVFLVGSFGRSPQVQNRVDVQYRSSPQPIGGMYPNYQPNLSPVGCFQGSLSGVIDRVI